MNCELVFKKLGKSKRKDIVSIKFSGLSCKDIFSYGGLASYIKGGYSSDCLPINNHSDDLDLITFYGTCINLPKKSSYLRIFEMKSKE